MAYFRFHKSLGILPGIRINLSKSGPSLSLGPAGLRLNVGQQGIRTTVGFPGSGLSVINRKSWRSTGDKIKSSEIKTETQFPRISEGGRELGSSDKVFEGDDVPDSLSEDMKLDLESWAIRSYLRPCFKVMFTSFGGLVFWAAVGGFLLVRFII